MTSKKKKTLQAKAHISRILVKMDICEYRETYGYPVYATPLNSNNINALLLELYADIDIGDLTYLDNPLLALIPKENEASYPTFNLPITLSRSK